MGTNGPFTVDTLISRAIFFSRAHDRRRLRLLMTLFGSSQRRADDVPHDSSSITCSISCLVDPLGRHCLVRLRRLAPGFPGDAILYVADSSPSPDTDRSSHLNRRIKVVPLARPPTGRQGWRQQVRNVRTDYRDLFDREPLGGGRRGGHDGHGQQPYRVHFLLRRHLLPGGAVVTPVLALLIASSVAQRPVIRQDVGTRARMAMLCRPGPYGSVNVTSMLLPVGASSSGA